MTTAPVDAAVAVARPGRPLDANRDVAILRAALELVAEVGYDRMSMEAIAARAHAGKATLYRRWANKAELVVDALRTLGAEAHAFPDTGDFREDVLQSLRTMAAQIAGGEASVMCGVLSAMNRDPHLAEVLRSQLVAAKREAGRQFLERALERGQIAALPEDTMVLDLAPAMVLSRLLVTGDPVDEAFLCRLVDDVVLPLFRRPAGDAAAPATTHPRTAPVGGRTERTTR